MVFSDSNVLPARAEQVRPEPRSLTHRETEIVSLVVQGLSNKEIARQLDISLATTKSHVHNVLGKLALQRRSQLAAWLHASGAFGLFQWASSSMMGQSGR